MPDNLTPEQRRKAMVAVKSTNTSLERHIDAALQSRGLRYSRNVKSLSGCPDFVFERERVVVFVDGDFWHGWRFVRWRDALPSYWQEKIERNRQRDRSNVRRLRRRGWTVLRFWGHQVCHDLQAVMTKLERALNASEISTTRNRERARTRCRALTK